MSELDAQIDRRRFDRFRLQPMHTEVKVQRIMGGRMIDLSGYAYDISEGGLRIELDDRLDVDEHVNVTVTLPTQGAGHSGLTINAACQTVWVNDEADDPAMPRMALRVIKYFDEDARRRLLNYLGSGLAHRVA